MDDCDRPARADSQSLYCLATPSGEPGVGVGDGTGRFGLRGEPEGASQQRRPLPGRGQPCGEGPVWALEEGSMTHCLLQRPVPGQPRVGCQDETGGAYLS